MIRLLLALIIVALLLSAVSRMLEREETPTGQEAPTAPEDTMIGAAYEPYTKAQQFSEDYDKALDEKRKALDEQIDGG